jgi:hypothetical protein
MCKLSGRFEMPTTLLVQDKVDSYEARAFLAQGVKGKAG